jgi:hypothetical protein
MNSVRWTVLVLAAIAATGCEKKESAVEADAGHLAVASASASAAPSASAAASATAAASAFTPDTPPAERKAEGKAVREITKANYKGELTKIEKEIGSP